MGIQESLNVALRVLARLSNAELDLVNICTLHNLPLVLDVHPEWKKALDEVRNVSPEALLSLVNDEVEGRANQGK